MKDNSLPIEPKKRVSREWESWALRSVDSFPVPFSFPGRQEGCSLAHSFFTTNLRNEYYFSHFIDKETDIKLLLQGYTEGVGARN